MITRIFLRKISRYRSRSRYAEAAVRSDSALKIFWRTVVVVLLTVPGSVADELRPVREKLKTYQVDILQSSVSGLSAGGFMASQFFVAYSDILAGAGIFAGGPYGCARGDVMRAVNDCMFSPSFLTVEVMAELLNRARALDREGRIAPLVNLQTKGVYLFSGLVDKTVQPGVVDRVFDWYLKASVPRSRIYYKKSIPAGHAMPTLDYGNPCDDVDRPPWISACNYDGAGEALKHIYGGLNPPRPVTGASGRLIEFNQKDFVEPRALTDKDLAEKTGLNEFGYAFVPRSCEQGQMCRIHVVFHGCRQVYNADPEGLDLKQGGTAFGLQMVLHAGYNEWAHTNSIIILYPQAQKTKANPGGCFDWWGYLEGAKDTYLTREAPQMRAVRAMIKGLSGK